MNNKRTTIAKFRQAGWLFMAVLCIAFSSAVKRLIQLQADEKSGIVNNCASRSLSQNIKDGHRERHEYQVLVSSDNHKSSLPEFYPTLSYPYNYSSSIEYLSLFASHCAYLSYKELQAISAGALPLYIRFRKLEI